MARCLDNFEPIGFPDADSNLPITIAQILASGVPANARTASSGERPHISISPYFLVVTLKGTTSDRRNAWMPCPVLISKGVESGLVAGQRATGNGKCPPCDGLRSMAASPAEGPDLQVVLSSRTGLRSRADTTGRVAGDLRPECRGLPATRSSGIAGRGARRGAGQGEAGRPCRRNHRRA